MFLVYVFVSVGFLLHAFVDWLQYIRVRRFLEGEFSSPNEALQQVAISKRVPMERLTIPSQRRYVSYFARVMEGVRWGT